MLAFLKNNGLTVTLMVMFAASLLGHVLAGVRFENTQLALHHQPILGLGAYIVHPQFLSTLFENWESEFLQMSAYVMLTAFLFQRGSSESADPDAPARDEKLNSKARNAPSAIRRAKLVRWLYARSLGIILFLLFLATFALHWIFSAKEAASEAIAHGEMPASAMVHLAEPGFWFESFQNWQSEFLSTAVLIVLSIYFRQQGSPESKPVGAPHEQTGE